MPRHLRVLLLAGLAAACYEPSAPADRAPARITALPRELTAAERRLIEADNRFAFKILRELAARESPDSNIFVSPLSMAMALGMTYNGAAGATAEGMARALELEGLTLDEVNHSYRDLIALLRGLDPRVTFEIANSIWYDLDYAAVFQPGFIETNQTYFDATVQALDFGDPTAAGTINGWVNESTRGRIPTIVPDPIPEDDVIMYLINAIYFKGDWIERFDKRLTRDAPFRRRDGSTATVRMMSHGKEVDARVAYDGGIGILDLPYGGGAYSMTIALPPEPGDIEAFTAELTQERWDAWIAALDSTSVQVFLPKFRQAYAPEGLIPVLKTLGMTPAFCDELGTDFSGIGGSPGDLCITSVDHKAFVDVNEEGTEAAAATAVGVGLTSAPPSFTVDRPFVFAIRENLSGTILFLGRIVHPKAG
ncbi:MAG: serpin family protein [Gemmatimonadales bacterium]